MQLERLNEIFNYGRRLLSKRQMFVQTIRRSKGLGDTIAKDRDWETTIQRY
jgi:hypothetical protein